MAPSIVTLLVKSQSSWGEQEWKEIGAAVAQHAAVDDRRSCIVLHDTDAEERLRVAVQTALAASNKASAATPDTAVPAGVDVCEVAYTSLAATLGVKLDEEVPSFKERISAIRRIMCGVEMIGKAPEDLVQKILHEQATLFSLIVFAFIKDKCGVQCAWSRPDFFPPRTGGEPISKKAIGSNLTRAVREWFTDARERSAVVPSLLFPKETADSHAAIIASCLEATQLEIWSSVLGLFTSQGNDLPAARLLRCVDYNEAKEMTSHDARLCDLTVFDTLSGSGGIGSSKQIPLCFFSPLFPGRAGTVVKASSAEGIKAIHVQHNITVWSLTTIDMWHVPGFLARVFECFRKFNISIDLVSTADTNLTVSLEPLERGIDPQVLMEVMRELCKMCTVTEFPHCAVISLVGLGVGKSIAEAARAGALDWPIRLMTKAANDVSVSFAIDDTEPNLTALIHGRIFNKDRELNADVFGPTLAAIKSKDEPTPSVAAATPVPASPVRVSSGTITTAPAGTLSPNRALSPAASSANLAQSDATVSPLSADPTTRWWYAKRDKLAEMTTSSDPLYVYDAETIRSRARQLRANLTCINTFFYALKANSNEGILRVVESEGFGFECVSNAEIDLVLRLFPDIPHTRILFTPNFAPRAEYEYAIQLGVNITLDSLYCLSMWPEVFQGHDVMLRIDAGEGHGHHDYVKTAGAASKFGISLDQVPEVVSICKQYNITVKGLHTHSGSGIDNTSNWANHATLLIDLATSVFHSATILDIGGGLMVPYKFTEKHINLQLVGEQLAAKATNPKFTFWMEPGRFIVAESGVLVSRVTQVKSKSGVTFVGSSAGMHSLIRPALYKAHHEIVNLSRLTEEGPKMIANVCGPICESGDILGKERDLPLTTREGDVMLIDTVGAYGRAMATEYNLRCPGKEVVLE